MVTQTLQEFHGFPLCAFVMIDIDEFKKVNDTMGHAYGDKVIIMLAESLKETFTEDVLISRMGGDEFALFFCNAESKNELLDLLQTGQKKIKTWLSSKDSNISFSMGVSFSPENGNTFFELYEASDQALYEVKRHEKGNLSSSKKKNVHTNTDNRM